MRISRWNWFIVGVCVSAFGGAGIAAAQPGAAEFPDTNMIVGDIHADPDLILLNGTSSVYQGIGIPKVTKKVPSTVRGGEYFKVEGVGPEVHAQWQIYTAKDGEVKATDYWVDSHLKTTIFGDVIASCDITAGKPGKPGSAPAKMASQACAWRNLQPVGGFGHEHSIKPTLDVVEKGFREVLDREEQDRILNARCGDARKCRFVPESFSDKAIGPEVVVGEPVFNTTQFMTTPQYAWSHRIGWSDAAGGKLSISAKILEVIEIGLEVNFTHTWGQDKSFSEIIPLPVAPRSVGYVTHQATLVNMTGHFLVDLDGEVVKLPGRNFDGPRVVPDTNDPSYGNWIQGRLNLYNCPIAQWNEEEGVCDRPSILQKTIDGR